MRIRSRSRSLPLALAGGALLLAGCAQFDDSASGQDWKPAPELSAEAGPQPELPEADSPDAQPAPQSSQTPVPPPDGCKDFDKAVIATCLDTVSAVAALPSDGQSVSALAAERKSGRVFAVGSGQEKRQIAQLDVDAAGDGGLTGLALSPSYAEDGLVFAYVTTGGDNRVLRFAEGQPPKPVLTGIPKGASGNRGALLPDGNGNLLVATGDAGRAGATGDAKSLAGKVLRITATGEPADGNPSSGSPVLASGLHSPGGLCKTTDGSRVWVTDQGGDKDAVYRVKTETANSPAPLDVPAWTWPDKPGVTGCADWSDMLAVSTSGSGDLQNLPLSEDGTVGGKPQVTMDGENGPDYGKLGALDQLSGNVAVAGTTNKDGGDPVSSDDRVVLIVRQPASGSGRD